MLEEEVPLPFSETGVEDVVVHSSEGRCSVGGHQHQQENEDYDHYLQLHVLVKTECLHRNHKINKHLVFWLHS